MLVDVVLEYEHNKYIANSEKDLKVKDKVVVVTNRGLELATVVKINQKGEATLNILRVANEQDLNNNKRLKIKAKKEIPNVQKIIDDLKLGVKVNLIEYTIDESKMMISFASEERIDFRELVKILASKYRCKIEMRQIGFRDAVKIMGGIGPCGRECCCKNFLPKFDKVSIKMAKNQNLSLNPTKISGQCGKLMCCLSFENEMYSEYNQKMPKIHQTVQTPDGEGEVVYNDLFKEIVFVKLHNADGYQVKEYPLAQIQVSNESR